MATIKTITLELVRPGPPSGQLLSPLTRYIALCESKGEGSEVFQVPWTHADFLRLWRQYADAATPRAAHEASCTLASGLISALRKLRSLTSALTTTADLIELRLIFSANELAQLPWELALYPPADLTDDTLCLTPIILTRQSRHAVTTRLGWPHRFRVLFIAAEPNSSVPIDANVLGISRALDPLRLSRSPRELSHYITILRNASRKQIIDALSSAGSRPYTNVHILAHGVSTDSDLDGSFQLELNHNGEADPIDGGTLAELLHSGPCRPTAVTLNVCHSAGTRGMLTPGGALANQLHLRGFPMVIASQIPLSFPGSATISESLYRALFQGMDPREAVQVTRRALFTAAITEEYCGRDWSALTLYGAFPEGSSAVLQEAQHRLIRREIDGRLAVLDPRQISEFNPRPEEQPRLDLSRLTKKTSDKELRDELQKLYTAQDRLKELSSSRRLSSLRQQRIIGFLASTHKRIADAITASPDGEKRSSLQHKLELQVHPNGTSEWLFMAEQHYIRAYLKHRNYVGWLVEAAVCSALAGVPVDPLRLRQIQQIGSIQPPEGMPRTWLRERAYAFADMRILGTLAGVQIFTLEQEAEAKATLNALWLPSVPEIVNELWDPKSPRRAIGLRRQLWRYRAHGIVGKDAACKEAALAVVEALSQELDTRKVPKFLTAFLHWTDQSDSHNSLLDPIRLE